MDGVALLARASAAGLTVLADGDRLVVQGPKSCEELARELLANKAAVMALLTPPTPVEDTEWRNLALAEGIALASGWRGVAKELAEIAGWPLLLFRPAHSVGPGAARGALFARCVTPCRR